jgi:hypothetical protein
MPSASGDGPGSTRCGRSTTSSPWRGGQRKGFKTNLIRFDKSKPYMYRPGTGNPPGFPELNVDHRIENGDLVLPKGPGRGHRYKRGIPPAPTRLAGNSKLSNHQTLGGQFGPWCTAGDDRVGVDKELSSAGDERKLVRCCSSGDSRTVRALSRHRRRSPHHGNQARSDRANRRRRRWREPDCPGRHIPQTRRQKTCLIAALARLIGAARRHARNRTLARVADDGNSCPTSPLFRPTLAVDKRQRMAPTAMRTRFLCSTGCRFS